jgi:hypothetical protein
MGGTVAQVSGELYRFSEKSPAKQLRTPGKGERRPLAETGNIPGREEGQEQGRGREQSRGRRAREEMKKQLNLSYFQVNLLYRQANKGKLEIFGSEVFTQIRPVWVG